MAKWAGNPRGLELDGLEQETDVSYLSTGDAASTALDAATATLKVAEDPFLPEVVCQVLRLSAIEEGRSPGPPCKRLVGRPAPGRGIGLRYAVMPLRVAVKVRERPVMAMIGVGAVLLGLVAFGYGLGHQRGGGA